MNALRTLWRWLDFDLRDAHFYGGILLVGIGVGLIHLPAALIVVGVVLVYTALRRPVPGPPRHYWTSDGPAG